MKKEVIFIVQAYELMTPEGQLLDLAVLEVYANTATEAVKIAKGYIKKKYYRVSQIIEKKSNATT